MKIKSAAIRYMGQIYTGRSHGIIFKRYRASLKPPYKKGRPEQGFLTESDNFVDRKVALQIAREADQIKDESKVRNYIGLMSEDLKETI